MYNKQSLSRGQSIIEVVIALALISLVLVTIVALAALSIRSSTFARNQTEALRFTTQATEWLRSEKEANWNAFKGHTATTGWCLDSLYWSKGRSCTTNEPISGTIFIRSVTFTNNADGSVQADIQTRWTDAQGTHTSATSMIFTNWK